MMSMPSNRIAPSPGHGGRFSGRTFGSTTTHSMQTSASTWRDSEGRLFTKTRRQVLHQLAPETEGAAVPSFADGQMLRLSLRRFDWCHNLARGGTIASASFQASRLERNHPRPQLNTRPAEGRPWQEVEALRRRRVQQRLHRDEVAWTLLPLQPRSLLSSLDTALLLLRAPRLLRASYCGHGRFGVVPLRASGPHCSERQPSETLHVSSLLAVPTARAAGLFAQPVPRRLHGPACRGRGCLCC